MDKLAFTFQRIPEATRAEDVPNVKKTLLTINQKLHDKLKVHKNKISNHHTTRVWDWYKRMSNEYEFVFTSNGDLPSSAVFQPVSRSFFKLWEMLHDFMTFTVSNQRPMQAAFLAEGPGGFLEAFWKSRQDPLSDKMYAMTLISSDRRVPQWKLPKHITSHVSFIKGVDGTGNLYNTCNIDAFVNDAGSNSCQLVTADGGFDFSYDFNNQELISLSLLFAETYAAFRLQMLGGTFVLKIFDVSTHGTMALIDVLVQSYETVKIVKPFTSRPANSEKYVICQGFKGADNHTLDWISKCIAQPDSTRDRVLSTSLLAQITEVNMYLVTRQILYIAKTIECIEQSVSRPDVTDRLIKLHCTLSQNWCTFYGVQSSMPSSQMTRASSVFQTQTTCS